MGHYDHRVHAGNAGDVWKHFLLLEAADCLLDPCGSLVYAESHVGRPDYVLRAPGDWEGGIGKIWPVLPSLSNFCYFDILADLNPESSLFLYPGSACLIGKLAERKRASLQADIWDKDPDVASSWKSYLEAESSRYIPQTKIVFHQADGFLGVLSHLEGSPAGLLFIDPPYIDSQDVRLARKLLDRAKDRGWIVLWWYMMEMKTAPCPLSTFELQFADAGLDGGRWKGAAVAFAGPESERFERLLARMRRQTEKLIRMLKSD